MALDLNSTTVTAKILEARQELAAGDFTGAATALQVAVDTQAAHLVDIAASEVVQETKLATLKKGLAAVVTLRDLLG